MLKKKRLYKPLERVPAKPILSDMYFPALTGLRAIAALMIFTHHFINQLNPPTQLRGFFQELYIGVSFFFVLSGFLVGLRYSKSILNSKKTILKFYLSRIIRIYPLYCILVVIVFFELQTTNPVYWITNLTLTQGLFDNLKFSGIAPAWALTVEFSFYLFFPLIIYLSKKIHLFIQVIIFLAIGVFTVYIFQNNHYTFFANYRFMFLYTFLGRSFEFIVGIYLSVLVSKISNLKQIKSIPITYLSALIIVFLIYMLSLLASPQFGGLGFYHPIGLIIHNFIIPIVIAILIFGLINEQTYFSKMLSTSFFQVLGASSYAFYLLHYNLIFSKIEDSFSYRLILITIISIMVYKFFDHPIYSKLSKLINRI